MSIHLAAPGPLAVHTVEIDAPADLLMLMPPDGTSWVKRGEGMVAWGEAARWQGRGPGRVDDAATWWRRVARHAEVKDDVRVRGTGLVAFGSFAFGDGYPSGGSLVVPAWVVGVAEGRAWLTTPGLALEVPR